MPDERTRFRLRVHIHLEKADYPSETIIDLETVEHFKLHPTMKKELKDKCINSTALVQGQLEDAVDKL